MTVESARKAVLLAALEWRAARGAARSGETAAELRLMRAVDLLVEAERERARYDR